MRVIFLSYLNRSGSTFLVNQLSKFPEIAVCPEADILYDWLLTNPQAIVSASWLKDFSRALNSDPKWMMWKLDVAIQGSFTGSRFDLFMHILNQFKKVHFKNACHIVFKHNHLNKLIDYYSEKDNLIWVNLIRNPLAVYASQKETISPATGRRMSDNPVAFADGWNIFYNKAKSFSESAEAFLVQYERLVNDLNIQMTTLSKVLGLKSDWEVVKSNRGIIKQWLSSAYREIHSHIDSEPTSSTNQKWKANLSNFEIAIISKFIDYNSLYQVEQLPYPKGRLLIGVFYFRLLRKIVYIREGIRRKVHRNA